MGRYGEREKGNIVYILDKDKTVDAIRAGLIARGESADVEFEFEPLAFVKTQNSFATICEEGVGWEVNADGELPVTFWRRNFYNDYIDLPLNVVRGCVSEKTVDLADFVRVFGARLENNFHIWRNAIKGVEQVFEEVNA